MAFPLSPFLPAGATPVEGTFRYDAKRAERAIAFIEKALVHTKGRHAGKPFLLADWQKDIVRAIFGVVAWDEQYGEWLRQYRLAWIELARKNGKSELLSAFALIGLLADDEQSAEVYSVASDKDQASLVFNTAKRMIELSPVLSGLVGSRILIVDSRKRIVDRKTNSFYQVLPGDAGGALGTNPSMVLFDEVLTQKDRHLWDAMRQGFGTRTQPIMIAATTAAYTSAEFALEEHRYGEQVLADPLMDPARYVFMRNVPTDWDWTIEGEPASEGRQATGWYWANPALGDFLNIGQLRGEAQEAKEKPTAQNAFRVFRLNQWVSQASRWLDMHVWDENGKAKVSREALAGRQAYCGLDLASTSDFTAWVLLFPGSPDDVNAPGFTVLPHFFVPRAAVERRSPMKTHLEVWERDGYMTVTEGPTTDYGVLEQHIAADGESFVLLPFGYDPWNATQTVTHLEEHGMTAVKVPQTAVRLNDPCKWLETLLADRQFYHGGNPILRWMADNVQLDILPEGYMKPSRQKSGEKIDGIAATLNALFVAATPPEEDPAVMFIPFDDDDEDQGDSAASSDSDALDKLLSVWKSDDDDDW